MDEIVVWCEVCGQDQHTTIAEAYASGWDFGSRGGVYPAGTISQRTCPTCTIDHTAWWQLMVLQVPHPDWTNGNGTSSDGSSPKRCRHEPDRRLRTHVMPATGTNGPRIVSRLTEQSPPGIYIVISAPRTVYRVEIASHDVPPTLVRYPPDAALLTDAIPVPRVQEFTFNLATGHGRIACWTAHRSEYQCTGEPHPDTVRNTSPVLLIARLRTSPATADISTHDRAQGESADTIAALLSTLYAAATSEPPPRPDSKGRSPTKSESPS